MPANINQEQDRLADLDLPNLPRRANRQDDSKNGANEPDADPAPSSSLSIGMATDRKSSASADLQDVRNHQAEINTNHSTQVASDGLLQIPSEIGSVRRPVETSIWDWDTPLESVGESSSYYFEPQGELLQEQRDQRSARNEFSIPHAVSNASPHWPFPASAVSASGNVSNPANTYVH